MSPGKSMTSTAALNASCATPRIELRAVPRRSDDSLRTSAPHIYAAGDCTSPHEIVHLAVLQGETAGRNLVDNRRNERIDYRLLLDVVFTEPQVATVGWTEKAAAALGVRVLVARCQGREGLRGPFRLRIARQTSVTAPRAGPATT